MVWTSGLWTVKPGREDEFIAGWAEFAQWTRTVFPGTRAWLLRERDRPSVFMSLGPWPSDDVITDWRASSGFTERIKRLREMLVSFEPRALDQVVVVE
jgi:heme-degrading monooxygenase HmoA